MTGIYSTSLICRLSGVQEIASILRKNKRFLHEDYTLHGKSQALISALTRHKTTREDSESLHTIAPAGNEKSPGSQAARAFQFVSMRHVDRWRVRATGSRSNHASKTNSPVTR
jgi:hypothetical protein